MGGQTFAKYITTNTATAQTATVAKWGLVLNQQSDSADFFDTEYNGTVLSTNRVVAPGTEGTITYEISGMAEVNAQVNFSLSNYSGVSLKQGSDVNYSPIKWTYQIGTERAVSFDPATNYTFPTVAYEANVSSSITITINWVWDFETYDSTLTTEQQEIEKAKNNKYDTILGCAAYANVTEGNFIYSSDEYQEGDDKTYIVDTTLNFEFKAVISQVD